MESLLRGWVYSIVNVGFDMSPGYDEHLVESAKVANTWATKIGTVMIL